MLGENRPMEKPPAIRSLLVRNLLSFGETTPAIELQGLNVLIGPNGALAG